MPDLDLSRFSYKDTMLGLRAGEFCIRNLFEPVPAKLN